MPKSERIGITMRDVRAERFDEARDALAQDWGFFMAEALPEAAWLPIPNLGAEATTVFCERWELQGLILSGGDDLGASPLRDETETALLAHFSGRSLPILGVCRGLQLMWTCSGGRIEKIAGHAGGTHSLTYLSAMQFATGPKQREVRSYHAYGLANTGTVGLFEVIARAEDDSIEGVRAMNGGMLGVMWHPERERPIHPADRAMVRSLFGWNGEGGE
jgi:putative glutamine amidotransferase